MCNKILELHTKIIILLQKTYSLETLEFAIKKYAKIFVRSLNSLNIHTPQNIRALYENCNTSQIKKQ